MDAPERLHHPRHPQARSPQRHGLHPSHADSPSGSGAQQQFCPTPCSRIESHRAGHAAIHSAHTGVGLTIGIPPSGEMMARQWLPTRKMPITRKTHRTTDAGNEASSPTLEEGPAIPMRGTPGIRAAGSGTPHQAAKRTTLIQTRNGGAVAARNRGRFPGLAARRAQPGTDDPSKIHHRRISRKRSPASWSSCSSLRSPQRVPLEVRHSPQNPPRAPHMPRRPRFPLSNQATSPRTNQNPWKSK